MGKSTGASRIPQKSETRTMDSSSVTFETKCWENDWEFLLKTRYLDNNIKRNGFLFDNVMLMINNVHDYDQVLHYVKKKMSEGVITSAYIVDDYAQEALDFFDIFKDSFGKGYYYSIAELVALYLCRTDFLVHFSSDSILAQKTLWIKPAIRVLAENEVVKVANPTWNMRYEEAQRNSVAEDNDFYFGRGFSDQCYLVRTRDFRQPIYSEYNPLSERYPEYGGPLFEKRVDSWMINNKYQRITYKHGSYFHKNFPGKSLKRTLLMWLKYYDHHPLKTKLLFRIIKNKLNHV